MKLITYNVNGIRAALRKNFDRWLKASNPDIICLQEIKAHTDQFDQSVFEDMGYSVHLFPAEKKGYSGVAIFSKEVPIHVEYGLGISQYDIEGRTLRADFENYSVISVYMPSGASKPERQDFKLQWLIHFKDYIAELSKSIPNLIICGDFNICHQGIDIHNPLGLDGYPGFTKTEREWMSAFLEMGFTDTFRHLNPQPDQYSWWSYRAGARSKNLGWRIDYVLCADKLNAQLTKSTMLDQAFHSDHCPVVSEFQF